MGVARLRPVPAPLLFLIKFYPHKAVTAYLPVAPDWFSSPVASGAHSMICGAINAESSDRTNRPMVERGTF